MPAGLLNVAKTILHNAASLGIEEAGTRLCGSSWPAVKQALSPIVDELKRRYPNFLLVPEEMANAELDLSEDDTLVALLQQQLAITQEAHREILAVLFRHEQTLQTHRDLFFRAFEEADRKNQARHDQVIAELSNLRMDIVALTRPRKATTAQPQLGLDEIYKQASGYQMDAMKWIAAGEAEAASQRLAAGRQLALTGLARDQANAKLLVTLGFLEKSQAPVCILRRDPEGATENLALAARYFARAMQLDSVNLDAWNGMGNMYYYGHDYDSAIQLGVEVVEAKPSHGPALNDLSLALEAKIRASGPDLSWVRALIAVYERLEALMPLQPQLFSASYLADVQRRLTQLRKQSGTSTGPAAPSPL